MHQDHLLVKNYSINHKREPARNQGFFSQPADGGGRRRVASGTAGFKIPTTDPGLTDPLW